MRPQSDAGEELRATYSVTGAWPAMEITFDSGDERGRNTDYNEGVNVVLARLGELGAVLDSARISSVNVADAVEQTGLDPSFTPRGFKLPLPLRDADHELLRRALGHAGALVNSRPGSSGSTTRRMTLRVSLPLPAIPAGDLEARLAVGTVGPLELSMLTDLEQIDNSMALWASALEDGSLLGVSGIRRMATEAVVFQSRNSSTRLGARDVRLGVHTSGKPWTVEINAPKGAADANGLSTVARDTEGRHYLIRQGWLRSNPDSNGDVRGERFRALSALRPVYVSGGTTPTPRDWYVAAQLDGTPDAIRSETGAFVHGCALARALSRRGTTVAAPSGACGSPEKGGSFLKKPVEAQPEKEVRRIQGEVWLALRDRLGTARLELVKLRHHAGYEVDGVILGEPGTLIEIKTDASAADVYEGVGQLLVYGHLLGLSACRRILLLPQAPQLDLRIAAETCDLEVHVYDLLTDGEAVSVLFSDGFLSACGAGQTSPQKRGRRLLPLRSS